MADELSENPAVNPAPVPAAPTESKKVRAPRRSKEEIAADLAAKQTAKGGRKRKVESAAVAAPGVAAPSVVAKNAARAAKVPAAPKAAAKSVKKAPIAVAASSDGFADLLELEAENQKLRKSLAEKLRSENADLRRKLGLK